MCIDTYTLKNRIRLVHKKNNGPVSHLGILINTGTRDESEEEQGMAHFIEHVIFKGTKKRKAYHILNMLDNVGGDMNAYTTKEETCIYASFLNPYYTRSFDLLSDICFNSVFPEKEIEKEKEVIYDEISQCKDSPSELIFDEFENLIFKGHPLGKNILGNKQSIKRIKRKDIINFISNNYHTDEIVISSVGNIEFGKLCKLFEKYFSSIPQNFRIKEREAFKEYKTGELILRRNNHQSHVILGAPGYSYHDERHTLLSLLNNILGGTGFNCRLNMNIREKYGICYSIDSHYTTYSDTGLLNIYFATDNRSVDKVIKLIFKELNKLKEEPLGTLQLMRAKNQIKGQMAISNESKLSEMLFLGKSMLSYNKVDSIEDIYKKIDMITAEDLLSVANEIFDESRFSKIIFKK